MGKFIEKPLAETQRVAGASTRIAHLTPADRDRQREPRQVLPTTLALEYFRCTRAILSTMRVVIRFTILFVLALSLPVAMTGWFYNFYVPFNSEAEAANKVFVDAYNANCRAIMRLWHAGGSLDDGTGNSQEEVDRLEKEQVIASEAMQLAEKKLKPFRILSNEQVSRNRDFASRCFFTAKILAIFGAMGMCGLWLQSRGKNPR